MSEIFDTPKTESKPKASDARVKLRLAASNAAASLALASVTQNRTEALRFLEAIIAGARHQSPSLRRSCRYWKAVRCD